MYICGSRSFGEDKNGSYISPCLTSKRSKRSKSFSKFTGKDKNPYADRGLDKFFALLADLDEKKQKIYRQMGSEDISFVQFVYSNDSEHVKPIVVKVKNKNNKNSIKHLPNSTITTNSVAAAADASDKNLDEIPEKREIVTPQQQKEELVKRDQRWNGSFRLVKLMHPYYCFPLILVLILLFLAIYGRSFAIFCTSISYYLVPSIVGGSTSSSSSSRRKPKRKVSEKNILKSEKLTSSSTSGGLNGPTDDNVTEQKHGHRRSW